MKKLKHLALFLLLALICVPCPVQAERGYDEQKLVELLKKQKIRIIVIRHGEAIHNLGHLMTSTKSPGIYLTPKGVQQVKDAAKLLKKEKIDIIYTSPLFRTLQTAQILGDRLQVPYQKILVDERLREQFFGKYEDRTYEEYESTFNSHEELFAEAAPEAEYGREVFARTLEFLETIAAMHKRETILLVTHGYNTSHICKCLTGSLNKHTAKQAEFKIYDFSKINK
jgi:alpha-ribazole phosphatase